MMECLDCGKEMIWQCDYDISDDSEGFALIRSDYECPDEDCELFVSVIRKHKKDDDENEDLSDD